MELAKAAIRVVAYVSLCLGVRGKATRAITLPGANAYRSGRITLTLFENSFPNYTAPKMEEAMKNKAIATDTSYAMQGEL